MVAQSKRLSSLWLHSRLRWGSSHWPWDLRVHRLASHLINCLKCNSDRCRSEIESGMSYILTKLARRCQDGSLVRSLPIEPMVSGLNAPWAYLLLWVRRAPALSNPRCDHVKMKDRDTAEYANDFSAPNFQILDRNNTNKKIACIDMKYCHNYYKIMMVHRPVQFL